MKSFNEVMEGREQNYILPFFWQRGEEEDVIREEMKRIYESGIRAVCVEARPHPEFLGPKWWQDFDVIMDEARKRDMKVWVLDDEHFPTGSAAGNLKNAPKELRRLFISERHIDAIGPSKNASFIIEQPAVSYFNLQGQVHSVIVYERDAKSGELKGEGLDLTTHVVDGILHWSVPAGYWRIFIINESEKGGSPNQDDYLNPLVADSTQVLIDTVYQAFYERYSKDFGSTLVGFFSDEPGFYNDNDPYAFESLPGKKNMSLPWSKDVPLLLKEVLGDQYIKQLPLLWYEQGENPPPIRYHYMNIVSRLYAENFTDVIGDWCRGHGVEYIGHVIEDNNVHARLGAGAGHFFRALGGQDMSGIDVVLWQLIPGYDEIPFRWVAGEADAEFFNYGLGKMASSLAHLDPKKKGRTMAEVFGAYGWAEGLKLMKWLTDHMLVRGVNHFVPHAFSAKEFPDPDCPPHLYARGKNPQFRYYHYLNHYTNRLSHLLSGGTHIANVAVLYHADAEWSGNAMYFHLPVKELMRKQIDCDVLPIDAFLHSVELDGCKLKSGDEIFDCLVVPYSEALPAQFVAKLIELAQSGLPTLFVDAAPSRISEGLDEEGILEKLLASEQVKVISLQDLANYVREKGWYDIKIDGEFSYLRYYHVRQADGDVYFFFNEHPHQEIDTFVELPINGPLFYYDAYQNKTYSMKESNKLLGKWKIPITLSPFETIAVVSGVIDQQYVGSVKDEEVIEEIEVCEEWKVSIATSQQYPNFEAYTTLDSLVDLSRPNYLPRFAGTFRYETEIDFKSLKDKVWLDLGEVYETAEVIVNGVSAGVRISYPYHFEISNLLEDGKNTLTIEVTNTLVKEQRDFFSNVAQQEASGLLGPVRLLVKE